MADLISDYFKKQPINPDNEQLDHFIREPRSIAVSIERVWNAAKMKDFYQDQKKSETNCSNTSIMS